MAAKTGSKIKLLIDLTEAAFDKKSWHGTNLTGSLRGLNISTLTTIPDPKRPSIWQIAIHCAYWKYVIYRKLAGAEKGGFPRKPSNWPVIPEKTDKKLWREDYGLLKEYHKKLISAIEAFPEKRLGRKAPDSKYTAEQLIYGVAAHDLYHAGQIQLVKKLVK